MDFFLRHICYLPGRRSVLGKTVPEVLIMARGRRPRAILKTEGTVFPNSDRATLPDMISWDTVLKTPTRYPFAPLLLLMLVFARLNFASCKPTLRGDGEVATVPTNLSGSVGR